MGFVFFICFYLDDIVIILFNVIKKMFYVYMFSKEYISIDLFCVVFNRLEGRGYKVIVVIGVG